ncbi:MAG: rod shape-determining protein RodA [Spirochaetaceae bacterium]|jgi:rod shape determining protein RodA|nr:rod shape-determining protein RodA [Spirochaetaceae bacterium]
MKVKDILGIDFLLLIASITLTTFGILFIYSSGVTATGELVSYEYVKQIVWGGSGFLIALILSMINYRRFQGIALYAYLGTLILLIYTLKFGRYVSGARAWIGVGIFGIQVSEFTKITTILLLARYLDSSKEKTKSVVRFFISCLIAFIPMGLILMQPDLGTSLVFIPILLIMCFIAGVPIRYVLFLVFVIGLAAFLLFLTLWQDYILKATKADIYPAITMLTNSRFVSVICLALGLIALIALLGLLLYKKGYFFWILYACLVIVFSLGGSYMVNKILKVYQKERLIIFLNPDIDPQGAGWHIIQSLTAIGSGGFMGKGYLAGTHSHYRYLPQQSTDFIFSIFSEEWGFVGGLIMFMLFLLISVRMVRIMATAADAFGAYIAAGLSALYIFHFMINAGMTMGMMPITGIPLLFMSYGGSSVIAAMMGIGLALSIRMRRFAR